MQVKSLTLQDIQDKNIPEDLIVAFAELAEAQLGAPEKAMLKAQFANIGGVLNPAIEHTGDLIHRMTEDAQNGKFRRELVQDKCNKVLRLFNGYFGNSDLETDHAQNMKNNAEGTGVTFEAFKENLQKRLDVYAKCHEELPAYNELHLLCKKAAISLAKYQFNEAKEALQSILAYTEDEADYLKAASSVTRDDSGKIISLC